MTDPTTIVCRTCGATNAPGDQFCGTCGSFLEWHGEPAAAEPAAEPAPPPATVAPAVAAPAIAGAGGPTCRACGLENPPGRTFCRSCGTPLQPLATAAPAAAAAERPAPAPDEGGGGLPGWLPIVLGIGLVLGVVVVVVAFMLPSPDPGAVALTAPPTATLTPTLPPSTDEPPTASAAPSEPREPGVPLALTGASASSVVGDREMFQPPMAIDGDLTTAWQEGAAEEAGEWIEVTFPTARVDTITVRNGYQLSDDAYFANRRAKDVRITVGDAAPLLAVLADSQNEQRLDVGGLVGSTVRIELLTTYEPELTPYPGSPFDDTAISEIGVIGVPVP
jgi:ribosomal protein L40E